MTAKFRQIINQLKGMIGAKSSMTDDDLIANIEAVNVLCDLYDDLGIDRSEIDPSMASLYTHIIQRIEAKENIRSAMPLIKALSDLIYGRANDHGPMSWSEKLRKLSREVVDTCRREPQINSADYLFALDIVCATEDAHKTDLEEYKQVVSSYLEDIDNVTLEEKIKRIAAYQRSATLFTSDDWEQWAEICEQLKDEDVKKMSDAELLEWCDVTGQSPANELKKRSGESKRLMISYLRQQIMTEFANQARSKAKRKLMGELKSLNDEIIGDLIQIKINERMSLSTIFALETIFNLRLQLAQITSDENLAVYESLCRLRFEQIAGVLKKKYRSATTLNEKIEIVERLAIIGAEDDIDFAIEEAAELKETPDLTYTQKLRLEWITSAPSGDESRIVATLLPEANTPFEIATLAMLTDYLTDNDREDVTSRLIHLIDSAMAANDTEELGKLLVVTSMLGSPALEKITDRLKKHPGLIGALSLPLRLLPSLATTLHTHLSTLLPIPA